MSQNIQKLETNPEIGIHKQKRVPMEKNAMGMLCFIGSEVIFFGMLILAYVYYSGNYSGGPNASNSLDIGKTTIFTAFLLSSSLTMFLADRALERKNHRMLIVWLSTTIILGTIFLIGQGMEYAKLFSENITMGRNIFGSTFFTLTGFHGLHVLIGLIMLTILTGFAIAGDFKGSKSSAVTPISWYWHFVDVVWIFVFTIVYLLR
jgi:heme/copper-type cytochrome/quinol oxidase subunit 3